MICFRIELMNRKTMIPAIIIGLGAAVLAGRPVSANEGTVNLRAEAGQAGSCFAVSVFIDGSYKILMSCRDLPMALTAEQNQYIVWKEAAGKQTRVGNLNNGKMSSVVSAKFDRLFITAEGNNYVGNPTGPVVVSGNVTPINFNGATEPSRQTVSPTFGATATPTLVPGKGTVTPTPVTVGGVNRLGAALAGIGKAILLGFVVLLVIVGVLGFLARRRGL